MCSKCYDDMDFLPAKVSRTVCSKKVYCAGVYSKNLQKLIRGLKYHNQSDLAFFLAKFMTEYFAKVTDKKDFEVVPVPIFPALWVKTRAVAAGKLRRARLRNLCAPCARMYGARCDGAGRVPCGPAGNGPPDRGAAHGRVCEEFYVGRAADGRAVRVSLPTKPRGGAWNR